MDDPVAVFSFRGLERFALSPGTLSQNLVKVQSHALLVDQTFNFALQVVGQDPHQSLGSEPVTIFFVSFCMILEVKLVKLRFILKLERLDSDFLQFLSWFEFSRENRNNDKNHTCIWRAFYGRPGACL